MEKGKGRIKKLTTTSLLCQFFQKLPRKDRGPTKAPRGLQIVHFKFPP